MKVGVITLLTGLLLALPAFAGTGPDCSVPPDTDGDGINDVCDNCSQLHNNGVSPSPGNCDTDSDGYGNACDGDFDTTWTVNANDFSNQFLPCFIGGPYCPNEDMDCGGTVNANDFTLYFLPQFAPPGLPGPSGLACAGSVPCPTP